VSRILQRRGDLWREWSTLLDEPACGWMSWAAMVERVRDLYGVRGLKRLAERANRAMEVGSCRE